MLIAVKNFFLPFHCIVCEKENEYICNDCLSSIPIRKNDICPLCEKEITRFGAVCRKCKIKKDNYLDGLIVATYYEHPAVKKMIHDLKFLGFQMAAEYLAKILLIKINSEKDFSLENFLFLNVPIHQKKKAIRGFNQTEIIISTLKLLLEKNGPNRKIEIRSDIIFKKNFHTAQSKIKSLSQRRENVKDTFDIDKHTGFKLPHQVIVFDDVVTTGATLNEIAKVLKSRGVKKVWGLTIAREVFI